MEINVKSRSISH